MDNEARDVWEELVINFKLLSFHTKRERVKPGFEPSISRM